MEAEQEIQRLKALISSMIKRVPPSVNGGSYDNAVAFKKHVMVARKEVEKQRPDVVKLRAAHNVLAGYY